MKQAQALLVMLGGDSVFLTGPPGAGKTFVLNEFVKRATKKGKTVAVTASTGIAATHIGGTTIHSWSGLGIRDMLGPRDRAQLTGNAKLVKRYNATDILVIDEVSMLHGHRLDMINEVCKLLRKNDQPFGGLQVILVGDLFQLPPITRGAETVDFAHESAAWEELAPQICYITEQHRQKNDGLLELLEAMRSGDLETFHEELLGERLGQRPSEDQPVTRLYAHNVDIDTVNQRHLAALQEETYEYEMTTKGSAAKVEQLRRSVLAPELLELKVGAEVMFVANNPGGGFVNGTRGQVVDFSEDQPVVQLFKSKRTLKVSPHSWKLEEDGKVRAEVAQLPLRLAWAITIHKSQGMSLDAAEIDLSKSFTPGMGYVALSRIRSLDGLYLSGINAMALQMHPTIFEFDRNLRQASNALAATTPEMAEEIEQPEPDIIENPALLAALKEWRLNQARMSSMPAYVIAHDSALELIATKQPTTSQAMLGIKGFGPAKLEKYGDDILKLVAEHGITVSETPTEPIDIIKPLDEETQSDFAAYRQETIAKYPNAFKRWQPDEESLLLDLFNQTIPLEQASAILERQPSALWARLQSLL
ncbi:MAG: HRDC domain-containing protein [Patescibacteria group bacterium]